jgi:hypothetical protein
MEGEKETPLCRARPWAARFLGMRKSTDSAARTKPQPNQNQNQNTIHAHHTK